MSCPLCGDVCRCETQSPPGNSLTRPRFEPEMPLSATAARSLIDPDMYDASEEQFAASLEAPRIAPARPKFVVEVDTEMQSVGRTDADESAAPAAHDPGASPYALSDADKAAAPEKTGPSGEADHGLKDDPASPGPYREMFRQSDIPEHDPSFWKQEVAARVDSYRARRKPRAPKYPSLHLKFEPEDKRWDREPQMEPVVMQTHAPSYENTPVVSDDHIPVPSAMGVESARIIEFPRSYDALVDVTYELADPVVDRPRIVEAPEVEPPPPALGGIIIEPEEQEPERRPGFEIPLQTAPLSRRLCAGALDSLLVVAGSALFGYVFFRMTHVIPPLTQLLGMVVMLTVLFWVGYQYLLLTYTGSTPGLRLAGLELSRFDGSRVDRNLRRWRVLASILSALSLGLGFAWCFLDEDALCWHDRITRTYLAPR